MNILKVRTRASDQPDLPPPVYFLLRHDFSVRKREEEAQDLPLRLGPATAGQAVETQPDA